MNLFDIIGPVMVGPSSSHTSGVVRIANVVYSILGCAPKFATIKFHGSFAKTYLGHGSHKAVIAGLMGFKTDDSRIRNSLELAKKIGMEYKIEKVELQNAHPKTIIIEAQSNKEDKISTISLGLKPFDFKTSILSCMPKSSSDLTERTSLRQKRARDLRDFLCTTALNRSR